MSTVCSDAHEHPNRLMSAIHTASGIRRLSARSRHHVVRPENQSVAKGSGQGASFNGGCRPNDGDLIVALNQRRLKFSLNSLVWCRGWASSWGFTR